MFASKSAGGFYDSAINGNNMPADVVEITQEEHAALLAGQSQGLLIQWADDGRPFLAPPPPLTAEQLAAIRCAEILTALAAIDTSSARPLRAILVGSATDADRARLTELDAQAAALRVELATLSA